VGYTDARGRRQHAESPGRRPRLAALLGRGRRDGTALRSRSPPDVWPRRATGTRSLRRVVAAREEPRRTRRTVRPLYLDRTGTRPLETRRRTRAPHPPARHRRLRVRRLALGTARISRSDALRDPD